jgi:hypothetical protein
MMSDGFSEMSDRLNEIGTFLARHTYNPTMPLDASRPPPSKRYSSSISDDAIHRIQQSPQSPSSTTPLPTAWDRLTEDFPEPTTNLPGPGQLIPTQIDPKHRPIDRRLLWRSSIPKGTPFAVFGGPRW